MKKYLLVLAIALISVLAGCGEPALDEFPTEGDKTNDDGTVSIEFYGWGSAEEALVFQELIDEFKNDC